jgi:hypothetical protein
MRRHRTRQVPDVSFPFHGQSLLLTAKFLGAQLQGVAQEIQAASSHRVDEVPQFLGGFRRGSFRCGDFRLKGLPVTFVARSRFFQHSGNQGWMFANFSKESYNSPFDGVGG